MFPPENRRWMYNRMHPGRLGLTTEFVNGVEYFINYACQSVQFRREGKIRCPCLKCRSTSFETIDNVKLHLYKKGFKPNYWYWTDFGEVEPIVSIDENPIVDNDDVVRRYQGMVYDAATTSYGDFRHFNVHEEESPNEETEQFYKLLEASSQPLWPGCESHSELSLAVRMLSLKSDHNVSHACMDAFIQILKEVAPPGARVPNNYYQTKRLVSKLGLQSKKIDCCLHGCMLYYGPDNDLRQCKFCGKERYKPSNERRKGNKDIPNRRMHYLPLIPRLKRLYSSVGSASHMTWHAQHQTKAGVMLHPSDGEAWKHFDRVHPEFSCDPRNIRLGLCADGFTPYNQSSSSPYSCWPVIVTPYNMEPGLCMTTPYMFLTCIIPGPRNPKHNIDIYLQPLIDELKELWNGVLTFDVSTKQNFLMKAVLMWTINDFPAYGMLSGWMTAGKLACPHCMDQSKAFTLKNGRKNSWFDCHRQFLPIDHPFRRNKNGFRRNKIVHDLPIRRLTGDELSEIVSGLCKVTENQGVTHVGYGVYHNWTKQSIFWELPYWKDNLIRHNLDVMHIEKNVFDNIFNTVMDVSGKTKDNIKARMDVKEYCRREELHLITSSGGKVIKPKSNYILTKQEKNDVCQWVQGLKMPDGYASNLTRCVDMNHLRLFGMKSHDCHIFMEILLPIALSILPAPIWKPITELSCFFKELCSTTLTVDNMKQLGQNIPIILCKLERIFPPGFFDSMEHLPIHLPYEAQVGGPVQYRWMYPFERYLNKLKKMVKNKARVEGSICEAYLTQEISHFCSYYFESKVVCARTRVRRNDEFVEDASSEHQLSVFKRHGRTFGRAEERYLDDLEWKSATNHVLLNCTEVQCYIK